MHNKQIEINKPHRKQLQCGLFIGTTHTAFHNKTLLVNGFLNFPAFFNSIIRNFAAEKLLIRFQMKIHFKSIFKN